MKVEHDAVNDIYILRVNRHQLEAIDTSLYRWLKNLDLRIRHQSYMSGLNLMYEEIRKVLLK